MWHKELLARDPEAGFTQWYCWDTETGDVALQSDWVVDPIAEDCKGIYNTFDERANWKGDLHHVACIPMQVIEYEWVVNRRKVLTDKEFVRHWCNKPENRAFRIRPGRI